MSVLLIFSFTPIQGQPKNLIHGTNKARDSAQVFTGDKYFDSGGPGGSKLTDQPGNYSNCSDPFNENANCTSYFTLCSNEDTVSVNFIAYQIVTGDRLRIFSGSKPSGPLLFNSLTQGVSLNGMKLTTGTYIKSKAPDGCLTFEWFCTTIANSIGWEADIIVIGKNQPEDSLCNPSCKPLALVRIPLDTCYKLLGANELILDYHPTCAYSLQLYYPFGSDQLSPPAVNATHLNNTFLYEIKSGDGPTCFGYIQVEQESLPVEICGRDTVDCTWWQKNQDLKPEVSTCSGIRYSIRKTTFISLDCDDQFSGMVVREISFGGIPDSICIDTLFLIKPFLDSLVCPSDLKVPCNLEGLDKDPAKLSPSHLMTILDMDGDRRMDADPARLLIPEWKGNGALDTSGACGMVVSWNDFLIPGCGNSFKIRRQWTIGYKCGGRDTVCIQNISIVDESPPELAAVTSMEFVADPSACKASVMLDSVPGIEDCNKVQQRLEITYPDPVNPGKQILISGALPIKLSLAPGGYKAKFIFSDPCFNAVRQEVCIQVADYQGPVLKLKQQDFFLEPQMCWRRVYAGDLDSSSADLCCAKLHFAIAYEDTLSHYREQWLDWIAGNCQGTDGYPAHKDFYDRLIDQWLTAFVFDDYLDLAACESRQVVVRAYEACRIPVPDPSFKGSGHQWFCYMTIPEFRGWMNGGGRIGQYDLMCHSAWTAGEDLSFKYPSLEAFNDSVSCNALYDRENLNRILLQYDEKTVPLRIRDTSSPEIGSLPDLVVYDDGMPDANITCTGETYQAGSWPGAISCNCDTGHFETFYGGPLRSDAVYDEQGQYHYPACQPYDPSTKPRPIYCSSLLKAEYTVPGSLVPDSLFYQPVFDTVAQGRQFHITGTCTEGYMVSYQDVPTLDPCGAGTIIREWTITNACGQTFMASQVLKIQARSDFEVLFPADTILDCTDLQSLEPLTLSQPLIKDAEVESLDMSFIDEYAEDTGSSCRVIHRIWTITDRCTYQPSAPHGPDVILHDSMVADPVDRYCVYRALKDNGDGYMQYTQQIRFVDRTPPRLSCRDTVIFTGAACVSEGFPLFPTASDDCTGTASIRIQAWLDLGMDNTLDQEFPPGIPLDIPEGFGPGIFGLHIIAEDLCGNRDTCIMKIEIKEGGLPSAFCLPGTAIIDIPASGQVTIYARDLDAGSLAGCTPGPLRFSFSPDPADSIRHYTCDSAGTKTLPIWLTNEGGFQAQCETQIRLLPGPDACIPSAEIRVKGRVFTGLKIGIKQVNIGFEPLETDTLTDAEGYYSSSPLPAGLSLTVRPSKTDGPLNGVSTMDLLLMEKHILGQSLITDPLSLIAADVNRSGSVTVSDLIELRRLILGSINTFVNNTSWRFMPASHLFTNPAKPWLFPETIEFKNLMGPITNADFIGVKTGDVNYTVGAGLSGLESRDRDRVDLKVETTEEGGELKIRIFLAEPLTQVDALQLGIALPGSLQSIECSGGQLSIRPDQYNLLHGNQIRIAWVNGQGKNLNETEPLLEFTGKKGGALLQTHLIDSGIFESFLSISGKPKRVALQPVKTIRIPLKAFPNPSSDRVNIEFYLPEGGQNEIEIFTMNGKKIYMSESTLYPGLNRILLRKSDLGGPGIYYFKIRTRHTFENLTFILF